MVESFLLNGTENNKMHAELHLPDGDINYFALYASCFTCTIDYRSTKAITKKLNENGIAMLKFDFPGLGKSEGNFAKTNFSTNLQNIRFAYEYLKMNYEAPKLLIGHSLGGAAMVRLYNEFQEAQALCTIAAPASPDHLAYRLSKQEEESNIKGDSIAVIGGIEYKLEKQFFEDLRENAKFHDLTSITKPVMVMFSPDDEAIEWDHVIRNFTDVRGHKSFVTLNNIGHLMMKEKDAKYVGELISKWSEAYC